jgi:glutamyl-tRNA synthetase
VVPLIADQIGQTIDAGQRAQLVAALPSLKMRAKSTLALAEGALFLFAKRPLRLDEPAQALLTDDALDLLKKVAQGLIPCQDWSEAALETAVKAVAEDAGLGLGKVAQPLRAALTGRTTSPGIFDVLVLLGREEALGRLDDVLAIKG